MKKIALIIMAVMFLAVNLTALTWGGVDMGKWVVFDTNPEPPK